jgi:hypothetical protein
MTSLLNLRRIVPAALLAATAALGGATIGNPETACAAPKKWNEDAYHKCVDAVNEDNQKGKYTEQQYLELVQGCCVLSGGKWNNTVKHCEAPAAQTTVTQPGVAPPPVGATQNPAPPPPPNGNPEVTMPFQPGPVSPG